MASVAAMLAARFEHFLWTGFYIVGAARDGDPGDELVVGPYQGALGCLRIAVGRGVCGAAAAARATVIVADVDAFDGHIACDSRARSEIVVSGVRRSGDSDRRAGCRQRRTGGLRRGGWRSLEEIVRRAVRDLAARIGPWRYAGWAARPSWSMIEPARRAHITCRTHSPPIAYCLGHRRLGAPSQRGSCAP